MRRFLLIAVTVVACVPAATAPTTAPSPSPSPRSATSETIVLATQTPSVTLATPRSTLAPSAETAAPSISSEPTAPPTQPTVAASTPRPTAPPTPDAGAVKNDGQKIIVAFDPPQPWFFGEASASAGTQVAGYTLNGRSLAGSALRCTATKQSGGNNVCLGVEIIPSTRLIDGERYELKLHDQVLGSFTARGLVISTPRVVSVKATQFDLTVKFDRPMLHVGDCGAQSWSLGVPGTIEFVRSSAQVFPAPVGAYTSSSAAYRDFLSAFVSAADISDDCTTVKLGSGWGGPVGTFEITVDGVEDMYGNLVVPTTVTVDIADEGSPKLMFAQLELQTAEKKVIRVAYSEAMSEEYVTDPERYYLNGKLVPASTIIECELANCAWVRVTFAPGLFAYGTDNTLTIVGVRDMAGNAMDPDIATSGTFQVR